MYITNNTLETAHTQVNLAVNWIIGGYENSIADQQMDYEELPSTLDLVNEIFYMLQNVHYAYGAELMGANSEVMLMPALILKSLIAYEIVAADSGLF